jgi:hypothetical protein
VARITGSDKEFLNQLGAIAASKMSKEAAEKIASDLEDAKQYADDLRARASKEVQESEKLRDKNRQEARRLIDNAKQESEDRQARVTNQKKQLSLDRNRLSEWEAVLAERARVLDVKQAEVDRKSSEAAQVLAQAMAMKADNAAFLEELKTRLDRTRELWRNFS